MEDIHEDKVANQIIEGLPPSFMVFGAKKELDPLEEFWMNKLSNIERQYDEHVVQIERKLLKDRAHRRSIKKQSAKITKLEAELIERNAEIEGLKLQSSVLKGKLSERDYETQSAHTKLERVDQAAKTISKRMQEERQAKTQYEKECIELRNRVKGLEKEKMQLRLDIEIKKSEKARVEDKKVAMLKEKWSFVHHLTDVDVERRIQTNANVKLCNDIEKLLTAEKSLEVNLLQERQTMAEMMKDMKRQQQQHHDALQILDRTIREKCDVQTKLEHSLKTTKDTERNVRHWKEELGAQQLENESQGKEIKELKRRNGKVRCVLADTKHKLNACLSDMKSLQNEKRRADIELETAKRHEKALHLEMKKNELRKYKLAEKILKAHPFLMSTTRGGEKDKPSRSMSTNPSQTNSQNEIESYKKKIWQLERHKDEVERKLRELQRKENIYKLKLDKYTGLEKQLFWSGKAMAKLEGDRNRLEALLKSMDSNMPVKVPFKKLVTDPSVLDRLAKNKILQKRILQQAEKIEELKTNARRILQLREQQLGAGDPEDVPFWKLSYWQKKPEIPENIFSGIHLDVMQHPIGNQMTALRPFTDSDYYRNYVNYLHYEIPKVKDEILHLEKKKQYNKTEKEKYLHGKKKSKENRMNLSDLFGDDEKPVDLPLDSGENDDEQCTPDVSLHGSSYDHRELNKGDVDVKKTSKIYNQTAHGGSSSTTEDERDDVSSEGASEIPSDKSSDKSMDKNET